MAAFDPAKRGSKPSRIELAMLDSFPREIRALPAHARIDGIDRDFLFGKSRLPPLAPGVQLHFRGSPGNWGPCINLY